MYSLLLIDDDDNIRERIIHRIEWKHLSIGDIYEAEDSETALALYEEFRPKLIITDIRIPTRNGMEVARDILTADPTAQIIAITGYEDFEVAQQAVALGLNNLIKKPISMPELEAALQRSVRHLENLKAEKRRSEETAQLLRHSIPTLREQFLLAWLSGARTFPGQGAFAEEAARLGIILSKPCYGIAAASPQIKKDDPEERALMLAATQNIAEELLRNAGFDAQSVPTDGRILTFLVGMERAEMWRHVGSVMTDVCDRMSFYYGMEIHSGLGTARLSAEELPESYSEANTALCYYHLFGSAGVVSFLDVVHMGVSYRPAGRAVMEEALLAFSTRDRTAFFTRLTELLNTTIFSNYAHLDRIKQTLNEFCVLLMRQAIAAGVRTDCFEGEDSPYLRLIPLRSVAELQSYVMSFAERLFDSVLELHQKKESRVVTLAVQYIAKHYAEETLTISGVCDSVQLSAGYFSRLFRQEMGMNFNEYLNKVRIDQAKRLLRESGMKIYEIASAVGYSNPKYFNHVFKVATGLPPLDYRNGGTGA